MYHITCMEFHRNLYTKVMQVTKFGMKISVKLHPGNLNRGKWSKRKWWKTRTVMFFTHSLQPDSDQSQIIASEVVDDFEWFLVFICSIEEPTLAKCFNLSIQYWPTSFIPEGRHIMVVVDSLFRKIKSPSPTFLALFVVFFLKMNTWLRRLPPLRL